MKTKFRVVFIQIFLFLFFTPVYSQWERSTDIKDIRSHDQIRKEKNALLLNSTSLDSFITVTMAAYHIPGLSACILKEGELVWHNAYGYADVERKIPVTDSTLFLLASISKTITGAALMQLYERGLFHLDDNVNDYLPPDLHVVNLYYPNSPMTFKMILSHVSSINEDWENVLKPLLVAGDSPIPLFDFLKDYLVPGGAYYTNTSYGSYPPASTFNYSNAAIALLGYLVEAITDTAFDEYCQKHIFTPLSMNETSWFLANLDSSHVARPYQWTSSGYKPYPHWGLPIYPAGLLRTSSLQLARFLNAFMQKGTLGDIRILDRSTVELMTTAHYPEIPLPSWRISQGLIWHQEYFGDRLVWGHTGGLYGVTTAMFYFEPEKSGVIVLTNQEGWDGVSKIVSTLFDYAYFYNEIYAHKVSVSSAFVRSGIDSLLILSQFMNPENHSFASHAIITSTDKTFVDSLAFYDDGKHGDLQAGDGSWGNFYLLPAATEKEFSIGISAEDLNDGDYFALNNLARFTSIGPIIFQDYEFENPDDTFPNPGEIFGLRLLFRNDGKVTKATNIKAKLSCLDAAVTVGTSSIVYPDLAPGETVTPEGVFTISIKQSCPGDIDIPFKVDISSGGYNFWSDTFFMHIYPTGVAGRNESKIPKEFSLDQNRPNPFNPATTIEFALPKSAFVTLKVYNLLGEEIATLIAEQRAAGIHKFNWDARGLASGVYWYRLEAGEFVQSKKFILMR